MAIQCKVMIISSFVMFCLEPFHRRVRGDLVVEYLYSGDTLVAERANGVSGYTTVTAARCIRK
jgi:hypothetical protein